ncbi:DUF2147 domain-containing protein [Shewanella woodyi]|uniref:Uncharacterized protein n=1 Tax=Shewanella woodyi (strain ATCC 51908 / MS32) TaxID=392500 RepID=B1KFY1_SHEWM|nr:DUF2147 domain-containing protein [Shewanella woodyi]ACA86688.1 hypothetical protein Swoo_2410 [Shewanella woodyi ATCC 51908]
MRYIALILMSLFSFLSFASRDALDVAGVWETQHKGTYVSITTNALGHPVTGKILFSDKERATIGTQVLSNFQKDGRKWSVTLYSIERDKDYEGQIYRKGDILNIDVSVFFISKHIEWTEKSKADVEQARFEASNNRSSKLPE